MYYNIDMYEQAGIERPAETWEQFEANLRILKAAGIECPIAFSTYLWVHEDHRQGAGADAGRREDGAGPIQRFVTIVFPLLSPTFFFLLVINVTDSFTEGFGIINVMTQGGPGGATNILVYKIYEDGFVVLDLSGSSAQSVVLTSLVIALAFVQFKWIERRIHYAE